MMRWSDSEIALQFLPKKAKGQLDAKSWNTIQTPEMADESKSKTLEMFAAKLFRKGMGKIRFNNGFLVGKHKSLRITL